MIDQVIELLQRQARAAEALEARLRALELVVEAGEHRFMTLALDEIETASEQLAGLELARSLVLSAAGLPADATAARAIDQLAGDHAERAALERVVADLRQAMFRLADARARSDTAVRAAASNSRQRVEAASAFAAV